MGLLGVRTKDVAPRGNRKFNQDDELEGLGPEDQVGSFLRDRNVGRKSVRHAFQIDDDAPVTYTLVSVFCVGAICPKILYAVFAIYFIQRAMDESLHRLTL